MFCILSAIRNLEKWVGAGEVALQAKLLPCKCEGWRPDPQHPRECQMGIVSCEISCISELWVHVRDPASIYVMESDWGRYPMLTLASTLTCILMYVHTSTYINIRANMHIFHIHMTKMELNCYFESLQFATLYTHLHIICRMFLYEH